MFVNEITPPQRWSLSYVVQFHFFNGGNSPLLFRACEQWSKMCARFAVKTPGAPVTEYAFDVWLKAVRVGEFKLSGHGPNRFGLEPNETEFFRVEITAENGWEYLIRLAANATLLDDGSTKSVQTANFWTQFENL